MRSEVLDKLVETHNELWGTGTDVSSQTSRSHNLTKVWQRKLTSIDSKRFIAEYIANNDAGNQSHKNKKYYFYYVNQRFMTGA